MATTIPNIVNSLTGSTLDIQKLTNDLVAATRAPQQAAIDTKLTKANAIISSVGRIVSSASSMNQYLATQHGDPMSLAHLPVADNRTNTTFSFRPGYPAQEVDLSFKVQKIATKNTVTLEPMTSDQMIGASLTLDTLSDASPAVTIQLSANGVPKSVNSILAEIKDISGYSASVVTIPNGTPSYLFTINRGTGVTNNFIASVPEYNVVKTSNGEDAEVLFGDNLDIVKYSTNSFVNGDLLINLDPTASYDPETSVHLTTAPNTAQAKQVLLDIVDGYNALLSTITAEIKYDKDISKRGGLNNNSVARSFLWKMRELTTANIRTTVTKNASLADVGVSTNLDGTLKLDQNKLASAMVSNPGMLESLIFSKKIGDDEVDGALKKMLDMTDVIMSPTSSFNEIAKRTQQVDLPKIETEVTKLDDAMTALQAKYLKQFSAMQSAVLSAKSTQDSLTQSMSAWTAGLK